MQYALHITKYNIYIYLTKKMIEQGFVRDTKYMVASKTHTLFFVHYFLTPTFRTYA